MDLNQINLPSNVISDLYQSSLIDITEEKNGFLMESLINEKPLEPAGNHDSELKWLGENRKNILIIARYSEAVYIPDNELSFLTGILGACKLSLADVSIINLNNHSGLLYKGLLTQLKSKTIILFGVEPTELGLPINFPHFQVQTFDNCTFLFSPMLKDLENDKMLKSKLWFCLKKIFNL